MLRESRRKKYGVQLFKYAKISITFKSKLFFGAGKRWKLFTRFLFKLRSS
jgi:hypothetical protein